MAGILESIVIFLLDLSQWTYTCSPTPFVLCLCQTVMDSFPWLQKIKFEYLKEVTASAYEMPYCPQMPKF